MQKSLILIDGPKGAGKSSVSEILVDRLKDTIYLSLDIERRALTNQDRGRTELNKEAFENLIHKAEKLLKTDSSVIIDCGLTKDRVQKLDNLAKDENSKIYKFFLKAGREVLLDRVRFRDSSKNNKTNVERFDEVLKIVNEKEFKNFETIETDKLSLVEVANSILKIVEEKL